MVIIIGAGISGLSLAYFLEKQHTEYILLESSDKFGGYIQSIREEEYLFELGPNSLLADSFMLDFLKELGLEEQIVESREVSKNRYIYRKGRYRKLPSKPQELLFNGFFSLATKWAIFREMRKKPQQFQDETLAHFFERRFSKEIADYALDPFVSGIYAGDAAEMLLEKTFPQLKEFENQYGSVIKGFVKNKQAERKKTISFQNGLSTLTQRLASKISHLHLNEKVISIKQNPGSDDYVLSSEKNTYHADRIVITSPAFSVQYFLGEMMPAESEKIAAIDYPSLCVVHSVYKKKDTSHPLNGFGGLNPGIENLFTLGSIWSGSVFPNRCPEDEVLFTSFVGGRKKIENTLLSDQEIKNRVNQELKQNFGIRAEPVLQKITRWDKAIPQYNKNLALAENAVKEMEAKGIYISGNWQNGVSMIDCVKKAKKNAEMLKELSMNL